MRLAISAVILLTSLTSYSKHIKDPLITPDTYPNAVLTPGEIFKDKKEADVCKKGYASSVRNVPKGLKNQIKKSYGIIPHQFSNYSIDHFIPLSLGGTNSEDNLWPQRLHGIAYSAEQKTRADNYLHQEVCSGRMRLAKAQALIQQDWVKTYIECCRNQTSGSHKHKRKRGKKGDMPTDTISLIEELLEITEDLEREFIEFEAELIEEEWEILELEELMFDLEHGFVNKGDS